MHAWSLPTIPDLTDGGAPPDAYAEYDVAPGVAGDRSPPLVHVASADGASLWFFAAGVDTGKIAVARVDEAGVRHEMGEAVLPEDTDDEGARSSPLVTAVVAAPTSRGGALAVAGCAGGELFLVECTRRGRVTVAAMDRGTRADVSATTPATSSAASTPTGWGAAALSATKAALRFLRDERTSDDATGAVRSLSWAPAAPGELRLLCLTADAVEEWEVDGAGGGGCGLVRSHRALAPVTRALRSESYSAELVSAAAAPGEQGAVVLLAKEHGRWSVHRGERRRGSGSVALVASAVPASGAVPAGRGGGGATVHAGGVPSDAALVVSEGGGAALFAGDDLGEQLLLHDPAAGGGRVLASAAAPNTGGWLMLTELMGVVAYAPVPAPGTPAAPAVVPASAPPSESPSAPMSAPTSAPAPEPVAPANVDPVEAEAAVRAEFAAFASGSGGAPAEAGFRLRAAGALSVAADVAPFAANSRAIVDALPKHWSGPSGPGPAVEMHLDDKARRHDLFLQFLAEAAGVWNILPAGERETVLEHGELVAALLCVRSLHNEAAEAAEAGEEAAESAAALLREAAAAAGATSQAADAAVRGRPAVEVCYSRATATADALLPALAESFDRHAGAGAKGGVHERAAALEALSRALLGALGAAAEFRRHRASLYPPAEGGATAPPPRWNAGMNARRALSAAASAAATLREEAARGAAPDLAAPLGAQLLALATPLLDACAGSVLSAAPGSSARAKARAEYVAARETVLTALLEAARAGGGSAGGGLYGDRVAGVTADAVAAVAEAHFGYEQLAEVCEAAAFEAESARDPNAIAAAAARLHHHMRTLRGAPADGEGTFAAFMFERMMSHPGYRGSVGQRVAEMLQNTPEEFHDELKACLEPRPPLLWLHQLRSEDYAGTAATLRGLSETGAQGAGSATLAERRRYLSLAKLSLLADGVSSSSDDVIAIDAALDLAAIQSRLARRRGGDGDGDAPLPPLRLVEACLNEGEGAGGPGSEEDLLDAFTAFASAGEAFRASNRTLLEVCWRRTAAETDWEDLSRLRESGGDTAYVRALSATSVARAARRCYDESAVRLGAPFSEVLKISEVLKLLEDALGGGESAAVRDALGLWVPVDDDVME